ncbi:hypothetical protein PVAP13_9NG502214 [Panicum virgatum]|uniref:Uncharacterized protein n=1 Tax=Panicum virgatum TaxID=38727 RepID=A0A8T0MYU2_PANVG|nr:hypothetical protein PVAP13_9NG502214 [Panicum virgatum]
MASSEGVRATHAGSTPWSRTCVSYPGFIPCYLSRLVLVRVGYAYACAFSGTVRFPHTEESRASPISRIHVRVRECGVSECGCGVCAFVVVPSQKKTCLSEQCFL